MLPDPVVTSSAWSEEDDSRLQVQVRPATAERYIYEPLSKIITNEDVKPYVWGFRDVMFALPHGHPGVRAEAAYEAKYQWDAGDVVESDGLQRWVLMNARCVYHRGQWCMRWLARPVREGAPR